MPGNCRFKAEWEEKEQFREWLTKDKDHHRAYCKACKSSFDLGNMGIGAVRSHAAGKKYSGNVKLTQQSQRIGLDAFFGPKTDQTAGKVHI